MSNGKRELGKRPVGGRAYSEMEQGRRALSDVDRAFIARMERARESGKIISDVDQKRYKLLTGKNWPGGGRTVSDRDTGGRTVSDRDTGGRTQSDIDKGITKWREDDLKDFIGNKHGGSVKKYAKGGGVRKARYK